MISSKFGIGQKVRHKLLDFLGVIIDVDPEYSLSDNNFEKLIYSESLKKAPWYHVIMEDNNGYPIHTYLAEAQLSWEVNRENIEKTSLDELSILIIKQLKSPRLKN